MSEPIPEIHPLDTEGRVDALAHIISGDHVTELSRANAREMLGWLSMKPVIDNPADLC